VRSFVADSEHGEGLALHELKLQPVLGIWKSLEKSADSKPMVSMILCNVDGFQVSHERSAGGLTRRSWRKEDLLQHGVSLEGGVTEVPGQTRFLDVHDVIAASGRGPNENHLLIPYDPAIVATGEVMRRLVDSCASTFSMVIGNERTRVPVA
jgi:hypothetical protein